MQADFGIPDLVQAGWAVGFRSGRSWAPARLGYGALPGFPPWPHRINRPEDKGLTHICVQGEVRRQSQAGRAFQVSCWVLIESGQRRKESEKEGSRLGSEQGR